LEAARAGALAIELCDMAVARWIAQTGGEPVLVRG
jgi:hypothetical protein